MAYPLKNWTSVKHGYTFGVPTFYSSKHIGTDKLVPVGTPVYAPFKGTSRSGQGSESGNKIELECTVSGQKYIIRFFHLSKFVKTGNVNEGDVIAYSGNTGLSTGPHLHVDISKNSVQLNNFGNFVDPDKFNWLTSEENVKLSQMSDGEFNKEMDMTFVKGNGSYTGSKDRKDWITAYGDLDVDGSQFRDKRWGHPARQNFIEKLEMSFKTGKQWTREDFYNTKIKATDPIVRPGDPTAPAPVDKAGIANLADQIKNKVGY